MHLRSKPPHDFYLALDVDGYFEPEYDPETIVTDGLARPLHLADRTVLAVVRYNEDPVEPVFDIDLPDQAAPDDAEAAQICAQIGRMVGSRLDVGAFRDQVADDAVLGPLVDKYWGFKRLTRPCFFDDAIRYIIRTRISHEPTRKRMVEQVRKTWGTAFDWRGQTYYSYPRPKALRDVGPEAFREFGISRRKGEYVAGLAELIASGHLDQTAVDQMSPAEFWETLTAVRGIGPSTAQSLMLRRNRADAAFVSRKKKGREKGIRRWIVAAYDRDPDQISDAQYAQLSQSWEGFEALVSQYFYYDWQMAEQARKHGDDG